MQILFSTAKKDYCLQSDGGSFELCQIGTFPIIDPVTKKPTSVMEDRWVPFKWYGSLSAALEAVAMLKVKHSDVSTLKELRELITKLHKEIIKEYKL